MVSGPSQGEPGLDATFDHTSLLWAPSPTVPVCAPHFEEQQGMTTPFVTWF